ncbi:hypothetical protein GCM10023229_11480 [Flavisolibacter ginsenosidimutans]|uniref:Redoxin domain-containing protein n=2 Tax=Flavisolibacter ginsenosidimutans TaxID=661481 RepID=A0A5B8UHA9_9BACT|nr:redoxin domain-containing protein [Flavisolibacter ginsenosidimutans]
MPLVIFGETFRMKILLAFCFAALSFSAFAQTDTIAPAYKRFPFLPPLQLLLADSTKFTKDDLAKNKQTLIVLFSPECEHCQHEAEMLYAGREMLDKIQIVMITTYPIYRMKEFAENYGLNNMKNVVVTKDPHYLMIPFYDVRNFPFMAFYDKKGKLIGTFQGTATIEKILEKFKGK